MSQTIELGRLLLLTAAPKPARQHAEANSWRFAEVCQIMSRDFGWGTENRLHWRLDVVMNEDQQRNRSDHGPNNLAVLRHMALNVIQKDTTKGSLRGKIKRAGWDDRYLKTLLALF